jgi:hypothetical protein
MTAHRRLLATALLVAIAGMVVAAAEPAIAVRVWARYWSIPPDYWLGTTPWTPPEKAALDKRKLNDLGIAFSGGGTRSATATLGQLRAMRANHWLEHVRYVTAVSGGSWAAVPFTYSNQDLDVFLGKEPASFTELTRVNVETLGPEGSLARAIAKSKLFAPGAREAAKIVGRTEAEKRAVPSGVQSLLRRFIGGQTSETYANLLATFFIKPYIPKGAASRYTWDEASLVEIKGVDATASAGDFVQAAADRPFLIVGGTAIYQQAATKYPRLIPVEYTPLYTGIRQQYGDRIGGIYVTPYAYDAATVDEVTADRLRVTMRPDAKPFTLSNVVASSGAAPLLALYQGTPVEQLKRATAFFPAFNTFSVRAAGTGFETKPVVANLLHGDGGFSDNLGLMPLLARQVHNIIVFVNGAEPFDDNDSLESMFGLLDKQGPSGDRSMNGVFAADKRVELKEGLAKAVANGGPAVYCGKNWSVIRNELYNIAAYSGLNICWVDNRRVDTWIKQLPSDTQTLIGTAKQFKHFPWYATFEENKPNLIRLTPAQVNLLAHFSAWTLTNRTGKSVIEEALGPALK